MEVPRHDFQLTRDVCDICESLIAVCSVCEGEKCAGQTVSSLCISMRKNRNFIGFLYHWHYCYSKDHMWVCFYINHVIRRNIYPIPFLLNCVSHLER